MRSTIHIKLVVGAVLAVAGLLVAYPYLRGELFPPSAEASDRDPAWLGVNLQNLTPSLRDALHVDRRVRGALVTSVTADSPADRAGLRSEDVITELDGHRVESVNDVVSAVRALEPGEKALVVVNRNGSSRGLSVELAGRGERWMESGEAPRGSDREVRRYFSGDDTKGRDWKKPRVYFERAPRADEPDSGDREDEDAPEAPSHRWHARGDDEYGEAPEIVWHDKDGGDHVLRFRAKDGGHRVIVLGDDDDDAVSVPKADRDRRVIILGDDDDDAPEAPRAPRAPRAEGPPRPRVHVFRGEGERSERGFLGVSTLALSDQLADYFKAPRDRGVLVTGVEHDSPADRAGIEAGDVILSVEDDPISDPGELRRAIRDRRPEATVEIGIIRRGERRTLRATLDEAPDFGSLDWEGTGPGRFRVEIPRIHLEGLRNLGIPELENFELPDIDIPDIEIDGSDFNQEDLDELRDHLREQGHQLRDQLRKMGRDIGREMREDHSTLQERREAHRSGHARGHAGGRRGAAGRRGDPPPGAGTLP